MDDDSIFKYFLRDIEEFRVEVEQGKLSDPEDPTVAEERHQWEDALFREYIDYIAEGQLSLSQIRELGRVLAKVAAMDYLRYYC